MTYRICNCGAGWDSHGIYTTCPYCAKGPNAQRNASPAESVIIATAYASHEFNLIKRGIFNKEESSK